MQKESDLIPFHQQQVKLVGVSRADRPQVGRAVPRALEPGDYCGTGRRYLEVCVWVGRGSNECVWKLLKAQCTHTDVPAPLLHWEFNQHHQK